MKRFLVEEVKVGATEGGIACGPVPGNTVAEVTVRNPEDGTVGYHSLVDTDGILTFLETDVPTFEMQMKEDPEDEEFWNMLSEHNANGICEYDEFFDSREELEAEGEARLPIWNYLVCLVRADAEEVENLKKAGVGKCFGDFEIPMSDAEKAFLGSREENKEEKTAEPDTETLDDYVDSLNQEYYGQVIDTGCLELEEGESPEAWYSTHVDFHEGQTDYRMKYGLWVNDDASISSVDKPTLEKKVGDDYVPCSVDEVSPKRLYELLDEELRFWL